MKTNNLLKKNWIRLLVLSQIFFTILIISVYEAKGKEGEPIVIKFVSFVPASNEVEFQYIKKELLDKIKEVSKGRLIIDIKGGPEVVPPINLGSAIKTGAIDMATIPNAFLEDIVPGSGVGHLSPVSAQEERRTGLFDVISDLYKKAGLVYLGRGEATVPGYFMLFLNKKVSRKEDFKGLRLGGTTSFLGMYRELGATAMPLGIVDYNTAMERRTVDGLCTSIYVALGTISGVTKYVVKPGVWRSSVVLVMNPKKWSSIPGDLQNIFMKEVSYFEEKFEPYEAKQREGYLKKFLNTGAEIIEFHSELADWFVKTSTDGGWKYAIERQGEIVRQMKSHFEKVPK